MTRSDPAGGIKVARGNMLCVWVKERTSGGINHDPVTFSKISILHGQARHRSRGADKNNLHCHPMATSTRTSTPDELEASSKFGLAR